MWPGISQACTTKQSTVKSLPQGPAHKVHFNLTDNLDEVPKLPANLAGFLEWPEGATDEWNNTQCPSAPSVTGP